MLILITQDLRLLEEGIQGLRGLELFKKDKS
jgi:hypothetical protein